MNIHRICSMGYFDRVIIDGFMIPLYNAKGIAITESSGDFTSALYSNANNISQGIAKISINLLGEADNSEPPSEIHRMRSLREDELELERIPYGNKDRYCIAEMNILVLKDDNYLAERIINVNKNGDDISKSFKGETILQLLTKAYDIQKKYKEKDKTGETFNIGVVEEVYVDKSFRRCRISTWLHQNLADIVKVYGMLDLTSAILIPGDFAHECKMYGMTTQEYKDMLVKHYKSLGYVFTDDSKSIMQRNLAPVQRKGLAKYIKLK